MHSIDSFHSNSRYAYAIDIVLLNRSAIDNWITGLQRAVLVAQSLLELDRPLGVIRYGIGLLTSSSQKYPTNFFA